MSDGKVLVVEDDENIRRLLVDYLRERAHVEVDGARDGVEALHQIATKPYGVIVLDLMMPYMSGVDFLTSLYALTSDPSVKTLEVMPSVVVITSAAPEDVPGDALQHRFRTFVRGVMRKPLDIPRLGSYVESLLR